MTEESFEKIMNIALKELQNSAPNPKTRYLEYYINAYGNKVRGSTGNLAFNACLSRILGKGKGEIYVDSRIAPYVPYTNEPWLAQRWQGKKNPNEGWFGRAAFNVAKKIAVAIKGKVYKVKK